MIEVLAIVGVFFAMLFAFMLGERIAERRFLYDERALRRVQEARFDFLLSNQSSERDLMRRAGESERSMFRADLEKLLVKNEMLQDRAAHEREALLTRIQAWTPTPPPAETPSETEGSHIDELQNEDLAEQEIDKLQAEGFEPTIDGEAIVDMNNGASFESVDEARAWRAYCKRNNLPLTTDPRKHLTEG